MRYKLLAIDLDGTLIDHHGHVPEVNIAAITRARAAGCTVVLCTGRALIECERILDLVGRDDPAIVSGGAMVA
ncbi:MAG: HAD family hydrolase, partial [bacterium]